MTRPHQQRNNFSKDRQFTVVLEDIRSQFKVFGEGLIDVQRQLEQLGPMQHDIHQLKIDMAAVKAAIPMAYRRLDNHETRISVLETSR